MNNNITWKFSDKNSPINIVKDFNSEFICHGSINDLGRAISIMKLDGSAHLRLSIPIFDLDSIYLDFISVNPANRNYGWGWQLLKLTECLAKHYFCHTIYLSVKKDSYAERWYYKNGYSFYKLNEDEPDYVWLIKKLSY